MCEKIDSYAVLSYVEKMFPLIETKYIKMFVKFLCDKGIAAEYIKECEDKEDWVSIRSRQRNYIYLIENSFYWKDSDSGWEYWSDFSMEWSRYADRDK